MITVVNDRKSLGYAAAVLGISLQETLSELPQPCRGKMCLPELLSHVSRSSNSISTNSTSSSGGSGGIISEAASASPSLVTAAAPAQACPLPSYKQVVGLDGEWRASMYQNLDRFGCSILQVRYNTAEIDIYGAFFQDTIFISCCMAH